MLWTQVIIRQYIGVESILKSLLHFLLLLFFDLIQRFLWNCYEEGSKLIQSIGRKVAEATGEKRSTSFIFQRVSMAIQRGNASCVLGTVPRSEGLEEIFEFETADQ